MPLKLNTPFSFVCYISFRKSEKGNILNNGINVKSNLIWEKKNLHWLFNITQQLPVDTHDDFYMVRAFSVQFLTTSLLKISCDVIIRYVASINISAAEQRDKY